MLQRILILSLILSLILFSAGNARSPYLLVMKNDFFKGYSADTVCMNKGRDSIMLVLREDRKSIPVDTVKYLRVWEPKSFTPYLLTAALVGVSAYTYFNFTGRDDAMYTAEGKARFAGVFWGGTTLLFGALLKEPIETRYIIRVGRGINRTEAVFTCDF